MTAVGLGGLPVGVAGRRDGPWYILARGSSSLSVRGARREKESGLEGGAIERGPNEVGFRLPERYFSRFWLCSLFGPKSLAFSQQKVLKV